MVNMTPALAAALLTFCSSAIATPIAPKTDLISIADKFIVSLRADVDLEAHLSLVQTLHAESLGKRSDGGAFAGVLHNYTIGDYQGYAGHFDKVVVEHLQQHDDVENIEPDRYITAAAMSAPVPKVCGMQFDAQPRNFDNEETSPAEAEANADDADPRANSIFGPMTTESWPPYGLRLISHRGGSKRTEGTGYYYDKTSGKGTWAYILDSGLYTRHVEFDSDRAHKGYNAIRGIPNFDTDGHGTHVAGTIGGATYGVAKRAQLIGVKVLHDNTGSASMLLDGLNWAVGEITDAKREAQSVINLSLSGLAESQAVKAALSAAAQKGITAVVAAGNLDEDAGKAGIADAHALVVAATNRDRSRAVFSNWGPAVSIFAPGVDTMSSWIGCPTARHRLSGTSMAAAHVAGLVVYFKGLRQAGRMEEMAEMPGMPGMGENSTMSQVISVATKRAVSDPRNAPNLFAYNGSGK